MCVGVGVVDAATAIPTSEFAHTHANTQAHIGTTGGDLTINLIDHMLASTLTC